MTNYLYLAIAIAAEVVATTSLKAVAGFSKPLPLLLVVGGYVLAFSMLVLVMRTLPVGVVYAIWSGLGIVLVSLVAMFVYGQRLDPAALFGIGLIIAGVLVIQLFSGLRGTERPSRAQVVYCALSVPDKAAPCPKPFPPTSSSLAAVSPASG